jgi:secreted trypsin-like serine protease
MANAEPEVGRRQQSIAGGFDTGALASVPLLITRYRGGLTAYCSGTVIAPRIVLTAGHCVRFAEQPASFQAYFGSDIADPEDPEWLATLDITSWQAHPLYDPDDTFAGHDLALVTLAADAPVPALPLFTAAVAAGDEALLVGWGATDPSNADAGVRRFAISEVSQVDDKHVRYGEIGANACRGDSGGPVIIERNGRLWIAGVASFGDTDCRDYAAAARIDIAVDDFFVPYFDDASENLALVGSSEVVGGCAAGGSREHRGALVMLALCWLARRRRGGRRR